MPQRWHCTLSASAREEQEGHSPPAEYSGSIEPQREQFAMHALGRMSLRKCAERGKFVQNFHVEKLRIVVLFLRQKKGMKRKLG